ncbi:hypothetical protein EV421DRAFT_1935275 [Armillaria borealis]|uniref:DUF6534 domain-containing protein n=1 Tax=Armillaria borealis TaxID=47425 RepID=A0AA39JNB3_9AGAR|nr:hypothetical protein EV421DRAFT_1935275 [Armillaria borealis]
MASLLSRSSTTIGNTLGASYVGATIAAILFGITNLQTLIYYKRYPDDLRIYRYSVAILWVLDALHVALSTHALYFYMIDMSGDFVDALGYIVWSFKLQLVINVLIVLYVQGLYAIRIWKFGRHFDKILSWLVFLAITISLGAGIVLVYDICVTAKFPSFSHSGIPIYIFFSTIVVADLIIATVMCYYLHKSRAAMNFSTVTHLLLRLMRLILVSGLSTSVCSLLTLIAVLIWPYSGIFLGIDFILPKLYINSLLAMFNYRRKHTSNKLTEEHGGHSSSTALQFTPHSSEDSTAETVHKLI